MFALSLALLTLAPAPNGTTFKTDQTYQVVGIVKEPYDPIIPGKIWDTSGHDPKDVGWAWKATFQQCGVPVLNVCRGEDHKIYLFPPYAVWMHQKK